MYRLVKIVRLLLRRQVKIVLIARVSSNKYGVGDILESIWSTPFVVWNKKQNQRVMNLRWKKRGRIMLLEAA